MGRPKIIMTTIKNRKLKTHLILGGRGFIGESIIKQCREKKNYMNSLAIDKKDIDLEKEEACKALKEIIQERGVTNIIILSAIKRQDGDNKQFLKRNNAITENIVRAVAETNCFITYLSSCAVYGEKNEQASFHEESKINPTSLYGQHKVESEETYKEKIKESNLLILRPPLIYSEKNKNGYDPGGFIQTALQCQEIKLWGNGNEVREFIHIRDATEIIMRFNAENSSGTYNLVSGNSYSYKNIAQAIEKFTNCKITNRERTGGKLVNHTYNNTKIMRKLSEKSFMTPYMCINEFFLQ